MASVWGELKRRNVVRVAIAYGAFSWLLLQIADIILGNIGAPPATFRVMLLLLVIGFPVALILAWVYELTPQGLKKDKDVDRSASITRDAGRKIDFVIIGVLAVAVGFLLFDRFYLIQRNTAAGESIAVLPFVNMSDDPGNEYFADGIAEEILNLLVEVPALRVTSRSSAFSFKGQNADIPTIAARLNVAHVLEGSVRKSGDELRITAQLIDAETDTHLWSQTYERKLDSIFAIQDEIATAVVDALQITLLGNKPTVPETDPEAYALYLQGQHLERQGNADSLQRAEMLLKQALAIDVEFAPAWASLSRVYLVQAAVFGLRSTEEGYELARQAGERALAIDAESAQPYTMLALIEMFYDWDFAAASRHIDRALALSPGSADVLRSAARLDVTLGRVEEAIALYRRAVVLDPLSGHSSLGEALYYAGRLDEASESMRTSLSLNPGQARLNYLLSRVLLAQGELFEAQSAIEQEPETHYRLAGLVPIRFALGDTAGSNEALRELIDTAGATGAYQIAEGHAFRGEIDDAFAWLDRSYEIRDSGLVTVLVDPLLVNLHDDPRWDRFLDKMGLPH